MKITTVAAVALALAVSTSAEARHRSFDGTSDYQSNGQFGLGLELGVPTGLNGKLFLNPSGAIDFGIGEISNSFAYYGGNSGLHLYVDYLWHPKQLFANQDFKLPFYIGIGGRLWSFDCPGNVCNGNNADIFGVRVPIGVTFDLNNVPLDIFAQFVPTLDFYHNYNGRSVYLDVDFSVGIRFWFS